MRISIVTIVLASALIVSISGGQDTTPPAAGGPAAPGGPPTVAPGGGAAPVLVGPTAPATGTPKAKKKSQATYPKPLEVPAKWELDIETQIPRPIRIRMPGGTTQRTFWYVLYTVTNHTKDPDSGRPTEQLFAPNFSLYTKTGQLVRAGSKVPTLVYEAIKKRHNNPHLKDVAAITGKLLYGEDNAKDGVAMFQDFDPKAGSIDIFIVGLSGETKDIVLPSAVTVTRVNSHGKKIVKKTHTITLSKTLRLNYMIPGEKQARLHTPVKLVRKDWILR
jgi:hypothetical protein